MDAREKGLRNLTVADLTYSLNRRLFVRAVGVGAMALAGSALTSCSADSEEHNEPTEQHVGVQYGFWVDTTSCVGCGSCSVVCREKNHTPQDCDPRRKVVEYKFEGGEARFVSISCMHCAKPACKEVCPAGAISKREDGIVTVDQGRCIGCKYCHQACPFGVPSYTSAGMDKCDCCLEIGVAAGKTPHCVRVCPAHALYFGSIKALRVQAGRTARQLEAHTDPSFLLS